MDGDREDGIGPDVTNLGTAGAETTELDVDYDQSRFKETLIRTREWAFLTANRSVLAGVLLVAFLVVFTAIELRVTPESQQLVPLFYMSSAVIGGNFTLITIVISISQLVISQQLGAPGELRRQIEETTAYREASAELVGESAPPPTPAAFLEVLLRGVEHSVSELDGRRTELASDDAADAIDEVVSPLNRHLRHSLQQLEDGNTDTFEALVVTLNTNYSADIHQIRCLKKMHQEELAPDAKESLETLVTRLKHIDVARQYLKTVYIQEELSRLSRNLLYVGIPVIVTGLGLMVLFVSTERAALSPTRMSVITPIFATVSAAPLAVLFAYVMRLSVVSERTAAITPFTTPTQESSPWRATPDSDDAAEDDGTEDDGTNGRRSQTVTTERDDD